MKLPITDQFLWDVYKIMAGAGDVLNQITKPPTMANWLPGPKDPTFNKYRKKYMGSANRLTFNMGIKYA